MIVNRHTSFAAALVFCASTAASLAQPVLVIHGLGDDLSADGTKAAGLVFDNAVEEYVTYVWERGVGYTRVNGLGLSAEPVRGSSDLSVLATGKLNDANWGNLNCFAGYCAFGDCTPGEPLPPPSPCSVPYIAHSWTSATGWVNAGSIERIQDPATGRFYGGTRCDSSTSSANDLSGNGRYIVGGAWTSPLVNSSGAPSFGLCGDLEAFITDRVTGVVSRLPVQPGTTTSRADSVNNDGTVITGYDYGEIIDPEFGPGVGRRICVWTNGVQTLIDDLSNAFSNYPVNGAGTAIVGVVGQNFAQPNFGVEGSVIVKWTRQPNNTWLPQNLGKPVDFNDGINIVPLTGLSVSAVSDDGATVVGTARYGGFFDGFSRAIIWRADVNDGVPMDLMAYIASVDAGSPILRPGFSLTAARGLSADGNAISVSVQDAATTCTPQELGLFTGNHGVVYLNGGPIACDQPRIALSPLDSVSTQYTPFGVALNVFASGTWPMTYTWQREDPQNPGQWLNLTEACSGFPYGGEWDYEGVNKSQLRVGQATCGNGRDGLYRVIVSNSCGTVISDPALVTFVQGTEITQQPANATACPDSFGSMFAVAISNSADLSSQWEIADASNPTVFSPLFDGPNVLPDGRTMDVFGSTGQFLGFTAGSFASPSSYIVRCQFLSPCGNATSETATLTILGQPGISSQPQPVTTCATGPAVFSVTGDGPGPFTYLWQWEPVDAPGVWLNMFEGANTDFSGLVRFAASGAETGSVSLTREAQPDGSLAVIGAVRCVVTDGCGQRSDAAALTVCPADIDCQSGVDGDDVILFFALWDGGDFGADFNGDGGVDGDDVIDFFGRWDSGC